MKKFLSVLMCICMVLGFCTPMTAYADTNANAETSDFSYQISGGNAWIIGYKGDGGDVVVPAEIDGYKVEGVCQMAFDFEDAGITSITFSEGIETIQGGAIWACPELVSIHLPSTYKIEIDTSVLGCGEAIAKYAPKFATITVAEKNPYVKVVDNVLYTKDGKVLLTLPAADPRTVFTIPEGVTYLADESCMDCENLKEVIMPDTVEIFGYWVFCGAYDLEKINISENCWFIGQYTLQETKITELHIPASVETIKQSAFYRNELLESITVDADNTIFSSVDGVLYGPSDSPTSYGVDALICYPAAKTATSFVVPDGVEAINLGAFSCASNLEKVTIADTVTVIEDYGFVECYLEKIYIPSSVTTIEENAFITDYEYAGPTIYGPEGSYAQNFATQKEYEFVVSDDPADMDKVDVDPAEIITNDENGIPDKNLYNAILETADENADDILTYTEAAAIQELYAYECEISNIKGIEYCTALEYLDFTRNDISDISPLKGLTKLEDLTLWDNNISDISPLASLENLTYLDLDENNVSDISALAGLTSLENLYLSYNDISDIEVLANLKNLELLSVGGNEISDVKILSGLTNLIALGIAGNNITDISCLSTLVNLEGLMIEDNNISDISVLVNFPNLYELYISSNPIMDISPLAKLDLAWLCANNCLFSDISVLSGMKNLQGLTLANNYITDISSLAELKNLYYLDVSKNYISDFSVLEGLTNLEDVYTDGQETPLDGLCQGKDGKWYLFDDGAIDFTYTGLVEFGGVWFYVEKGVLNWDYNGLVLYNGVWFYVSGGSVQWDYAGLVEFGGVWFYVSGGSVQWNYTGLALHAGVWFYIENGSVNWTYRGLTNYNGVWFFVENGSVNWNYNSLVEWNGVWFYVSGGSVQWNYVGLVEYQGIWFYVTGGSVNWTYEGWIEWNGVWFYIKNGTIDWNHQ